MPKVLILQLNRSEYNSAEGTMVKKIHKVQVPRKLYPQRFLLKNRDKVEFNRVEVDRLRDEMKRVSDSRDLFNNYNESETPLLRAVDLVSNFILSQQLCQEPTAAEQLRPD